MTLRWLPFRGQGHLMVNHLVERWRHDMGAEARYEPMCGMIGLAPVELRDGEWWCVACRRMAGDRRSKA